MSQVIKRPLVTEKNNKKTGVYVFEVDRSANKKVIREHIEKYFEVKVDSVKTAVCRGRPKKTRRGTGKVPYWKKALVRLQKGEKISLFEGS